MLEELVRVPAPAEGPARPPLRIAVASSDGVRIDQHFGQTDTFRVFDVSSAGTTVLDSREVTSHAVGDEDRRDTICRMLADCRMLLVAKIGIAPQEKLAIAGIEASDLFAGKAVDAALAEVFVAKSSVAADVTVDASGFRLLHAMLRVSDLDRSLDFYTRLLGMTVLERREHKKNQFTQVYLGYGDGFDQMALELVFNWTQEEPYVLGNSFGHIAIQVAGIGALCDRLSTAGIKMPRPPRGQRHHENIVAFVEDPDGHRIELVQVPAAA